MEKRAESRRVRMTKRLIQDALVELLRDKPISKVSVSELCALADVNRTTFYKHYTTQDDVLREVGERIAGEIAASAVPGEGTQPLPLSAQVAGICGYLKSHPSESRFLLTHFSADDDVIKGLLESRLATGQADFRKTIPGYDNATKKLLGSFVTHGIFSLIRSWLLDEVDKSPEEIGMLATEIAGHGWIETTPKRQDGGRASTHKGATR